MYASELFYWQQFIISAEKIIDKCKIEDYTEYILMAQNIVLCQKNICEGGGAI